MTPVRVFVLSATRPLRARRIADRLSRDRPDLEICGVVQGTLRQLPWIQQRIAVGDIDRSVLRDRTLLTTRVRIRTILSRLVHWFLWCVHGCPRGLHSRASFTPEDLAACCGRAGWPFLAAADLDGPNVLSFIRCHHPDLIVVLGEVSPRQEMLDISSLGLVRVVQGASASADATTGEEIPLTLEYFPKGTDCPRPLASLNVPWQSQDGPFSKVLKCDLIIDDLLLHTAKCLGKGTQTQASKEVKEWMHRILSPYLDQFRPQQTPVPREALHARRYRSIARLCAQSLLLCPWVTCRNWYRRLRGRYPVLILTHHLVSDRPHRMGISTEEFWRQVRFLQRHYRIVSLSEACELLSSGRVSAPTAVLTFDDGYRDNFVTLRAVAEETRTPIAMYVATQPVEDDQEFHHDLKSATRGFLALTWDQIRYWNTQGAEFGSHTRTHFDCGATDAIRLHEEIVGSKKDLEEALGKPVKFFAFPFGKPENISQRAAELVAATYAFFDSALGGENLPENGPCRQHLLRKNFYSDPWELELEMQSVFDLVQRTKLRLARPLSALSE